MPTSTSIFNSLILGYIVLFFNKQNLFARLASGATLESLLLGVSSVGEDKLDKTRLTTILHSAQSMGMLELKNDTYHLTALGRDLEQNRGFFTWAIGGYSPLLESMETFVARPETAWQPYVRGNYVAIGSDECNQGLMQPIFERVIDELPAACIADLGCGNAGRLVDLLTRRPNITGVGIDIDPGAIEAADQNRAAHHLQDRLQLIQEDVFTSLAGPRPELDKVELVMSFMMLHDLFSNRKLDENLFTRMKKAFPKAKYFVLADTCLDPGSRNADTMPIFTMGYELVHALRGIQVFPLSHYEQRFAQEGLKLIATHDFGVPNTYLFVLEI